MDKKLSHPSFVSRCSLLCNELSTEKVCERLTPKPPLLPLQKLQNLSALNSKLKILLYLSNEYWAIHSENSNIEKMLFQNYPYSQRQSNQAYTLTHDTSQEEKMFEICETLTWIFKSFVVDRTKNMPDCFKKGHSQICMGNMNIYRIMKPPLPLGHKM